MSGQALKSTVADSMWLQIDTPEPGYAGMVVTLVARIARTTSGRTVLEGIRASGRCVKIEKPVRPTNPPNAWTRLCDRRDESNVDIVIAYDPADWPNPAEPKGRPSDVVLFGLLEDALIMATGAQYLNEPGMQSSSAMDAYLRERVPQRRQSEATP